MAKVKMTIKQVIKENCFKLRLAYDMRDKQSIYLLRDWLSVYVPKRHEKIVFIVHKGR